MPGPTLRVQLRNLPGTCFCVPCEGACFSRSINTLWDCLPTADPTRSSACTCGPVPSPSKQHSRHPSRLGGRRASPLSPAACTRLGRVPGDGTQLPRDCACGGRAAPPPCRRTRRRRIWEGRERGRCGAPRTEEVSWMQQEDGTRTTHLLLDLTFCETEINFHLVYVSPQMRAKLPPVVTSLTLLRFHLSAGIRFPRAGKKLGHLIKIALKL